MRERLLALDVLRGLTVALMLLVNNPGSWAHVWPPLRHARWHGWTPTDLVFPFFLFIVGTALALSQARRRAGGAGDGDLLRKALRRAGIIFALGLLLNAFPFGIPLNAAAAAAFVPGDLVAWLGELRLWGVLQRIALCYLLTAVVVLKLPRERHRWLAAGALVGLYELGMRLPLVAGWGAGSFALEDNFLRWLDLRLFGAAHLWPGAGVPFDPEGLWSSLTATVTVLLGFAAGRWLLREGSTGRALVRLAGAGGALLTAGLALAPLEPINKQLWTVPYVALTGGLALVLLALLIWLLDVRRWRRWSAPARIYGTNPLIAFVGSGLLARLLFLLKTPEGISWGAWLYRHVFAPLGGATGGSAMQALAHVALWLAVLWWLDRRRLYLKV